MAPAFDAWIRRHPHFLVPAALLLTSVLAFAQGDPWGNAVQVLQTAFTGTMARGLAVVAIVVGGLMFAFGEGQSKRMLAGIVFGFGHGHRSPQLHGMAVPT